MSLSLNWHPGDLNTYVCSELVTGWSYILNVNSVFTGEASLISAIK